MPCQTSLQTTLIEEGSAAKAEASKYTRWDIRSLCVLTILTMWYWTPPLCILTITTYHKGMDLHYEVCIMLIYLLYGIFARYVRPLCVKITYLHMEYTLIMLIYLPYGPYAHYAYLPYLPYGIGPPLCILSNPHRETDLHDAICTMLIYLACGIYALSALVFFKMYTCIYNTPIMHYALCV